MGCRVIEVTVHPEAEAEYEQTLAWYLDRSPQAAARFETAFDEAIEAIRSNPTMYPLIDEIYRFVVISRYPIRLVYRSDGDEAKVIAVAHAKRLPKDWRERK
jgi:plasmid stabilization system protein ParE